MAGHFEQVGWVRDPKGLWAKKPPNFQKSERSAVRNPTKSFFFHFPFAYSHYFVTGVAGRAASSAAVQLRKTNMSCIAGHQQGKQIAYATRADGSTITSIIAGSCYEHDEDYMSPQGNKHWRGCFMCHQVNDCAFDEMWLSLAYLNTRAAK